jgi:hypothetical protein
MYSRIYEAWLISYMYLTRYDQIQSHGPVKNDDNRMLNYLHTGFHAAPGSTQIYQNTSEFDPAAHSIRMLLMNESSQWHQ